MLAGRKTVTRRDWHPRYAKSFSKGQECHAYDNSPRVHGNPIAIIGLTHDPVFQPLAQMPDSDYEAEGLAWLAAQAGVEYEAGWQTFRVWRNSGGALWVIRFELLQILGAALPKDYPVHYPDFLPRGIYVTKFSPLL